jgi:hypothetical protein
MPSQSRGGIPEAHTPSENAPVRFSFKYLDGDNSRFQILCCESEFFTALLRSLQLFSTWTVDIFMDQNNKQHRHTIDFGCTSEPNGFINAPNFDPEQLGIHEAWQLSIYPFVPYRSERVHGILIDDTFFVVWLDPRHILYPERKYLQARNA